MLGCQCNRTFGNRICCLWISTQHVRSRLERKRIAKTMWMPQLFGEVHRGLSKCQPTIDLSEQRKRKRQVSLRKEWRKCSVMRRIVQLERIAQMVTGRNQFANEEQRLAESTMTHQFGHRILLLIGKYQ